MVVVPADLTVATVPLLVVEKVAEVAEVAEARQLKRQSALLRQHLFPLPSVAEDLVDRKAVVVPQEARVQQDHHLHLSAYQLQVEMVAEVEPPMVLAARADQR